LVAPIGASCRRGAVDGDDGAGLGGEDVDVVGLPVGGGVEQVALAPLQRVDGESMAGSLVPKPPSWPTMYCETRIFLSAETTNLAVVEGIWTKSPALARNLLTGWSGVKVRVVRPRWR
jgi:hypothetical protein